jgi:hypothetical protein
MTDTCIHLRDAARPLGLDVCPPPASWRPALDFLVCKRPPRASYPATDSLASASSPLTKTGGTVTGRRSSAAARPSPWQFPDDQPPSTTSPAPASTYSVAGSRRPHRSRRRSGRPETGPVSRRTIPQRTDMQSGLKTRRVEAGAFSSFSGARGGRGDSAPPQLGQRRPRTRSAQSVHQVHSKEQIHASLAEGDRSRSQHSQLGRISSMLDHSTAGREAASPWGS